MAVTPTPRIGLKRWSAGTDPWPARSGWDEQQQKLDDIMAMDSQGPLSARPVAGVRGRYYFSTDTGRLHRDDGTAWNEVGPVGGVNPAALTFGGAVAEGTSLRAARADHVHAMPAHDAAAHSTIPLSAHAAATAAVPMGGQKITGLADGTAAQDAATVKNITDNASSTTPTAEAFGDTGQIGVSNRHARADHRHAMPAHDAAAHNAIPLSAHAAATADVAMGGFKLTGLADPTANQDAATRLWTTTQIGAIEQVKYKTADTTRSNTTALVDDPDLVHGGIAVGSYLFELRLIYSSTTVADWKGFLTATGSLTNRRFTSLRNNAGALAFNMHENAVTFTADGLGAGSKQGILVTGTFDVGAAAQAFNLQWAQNTAEVSNTILHAGSYFRIRRFA